MIILNGLKSHKGSSTIDKVLDNKALPRKNSLKPFRSGGNRKPFPREPRDPLRQGKKHFSQRGNNYPNQGPKAVFSDSSTSPTCSPPGTYGNQQRYLYNWEKISSDSIVHSVSGERYKIQFTYIPNLIPPIISKPPRGKFFAIQKQITNYHFPYR